MHTRLRTELGVSGKEKRQPDAVQQRSFASLAGIPSNIRALESGLTFAAGLQPFVALVGPTGWGKTHLLEAVAYRISLDFELAPEVLPACDFTVHGPKSESTTPLILDDVQDAMRKPKQRQLLRYALEGRVRAGRPTMLAFTMEKETRQLRSFLPGCRDWVIATMAEPEEAERITLIDQMSQNEGLALSPGLTDIIARHMRGNGRTLSGALKRLRLADVSWLDSRATLRACGVLDAFFSDNPAWDLRLTILRAAEACRARFSRISVIDLALYAMLHEAALGEADVARTVGVEPAEAYLRASRFAKEMQASGDVGANVRQFVDLVVQSLCND